MTYNIVFNFDSPEKPITAVLSDIISVNFSKERYTPYTTLTGKMFMDSKFTDVKSIELRCSDTTVHHGPPDAMDWENKNGCFILTFSSRGYTSMLGQNQLVPGIHYNISLSELLASEIALPNVSYDSNDAKLNYVFIKENDTMWDAAAAFTRKMCGDYPYISGANTVAMTRQCGDEVMQIDYDDIISASEGSDLSRIISHYHMRDLEGTYSTYNLVNEDALARDIIRHKHISFDRQWLSDPNEAMQYRFDFSQRGYKYRKVCYSGYNLEDIRQYASFDARSVYVDAGEISRIELALSARGAETTLWFYEDNYTKQ